MPSNTVACRGPKPNSALSRRENAPVGWSVNVVMTAVSHRPPTVSATCSDRAQVQHQLGRARPPRAAPGCPSPAGSGGRRRSTPSPSSHAAAATLTCSTPSATVAEHQLPGQPRRRARARDQQLRRGRRHRELGRVAEAGVEVLPGGRDERRPAARGGRARLGRRAGARGARAPSHAAPPPGAAAGPAGARPTRRPRASSPSTRRGRSARRGRGASVLDRRASPGRSGGPRRCRCRRPRRSRRAAPPRRAGAAAAPRRRARRGGRSRTGPARRRWRPSAVAGDVHRAQRRRLGVGHPQHRRRRRRRARPEGWAKNASAGGAVAQPLVRRARQHGASPVTGSNAQSWWLPAIATTTRPVPPGQVPRRRQLGRASRPASTRSRSCAPVPATVVTAPSASRSPAQRVVDAVGDHHVVAAVRRRAGSSTALRLGEPRRRAPSTSPRAPVPIRRRSVTRSASSSTSWWWAVSETRNVPPGSAIDLAGEPQRGRGLRRRRRTGRRRGAACRRLVLGDQLVDQHGQPVRVALAGHLRDDVAPRVDHDERRPRPRGVRVPRRSSGSSSTGWCTP